MERRQLEGPARDILARCGDVPLYTAGRDTLAALTGYELTRGVLCAMRRPSLPAVEELCAGARRVAVLEGIVDPTNVGAIFRSAAALHMDGVLVTPTCCDPLPSPGGAGQHGHRVPDPVDLYRGALRRLAPAGTCPPAGPGLSDPPPWP